MKRTTKSIVLLAFLISLCQFSFSQEMGRRFKMEGSDPVTLNINTTFTSSAEISPFDKNVNKVFGLSVSTQIHFDNASSLVRFILVDKNHEEYQIYESYPLQDGDMDIDVDQVCEETALLKNDVKVNFIKIEITDAEVKLKSISYTRNLGQGINLEQATKEIKRAQQEEKVKQLNSNLQAKGLHWTAGITSVSEMSYSERKKLFGNSKFPAGFEYYAGGVISAGTPEVQLKSATATSPYVEDWDWRNRHGKNWITPIANQGSCGSCWAFASTGATEAMVNLFFNQQLNLNLSEQDVLSCSGGGTCSGGYPSTALNYIAKTGIVDETAFPYNGTDQACTNKNSNPGQLIKIGGRIDFGSTTYPKTEDDLKRMLIQMGPVSGGLYDWSHAMVLVGYKVVKEGDVFYYRDLNLTRSWKTVSAGDPLIGKTVWIFKNSWGTYFGDAGYVYVETPITNMGWTHAIQTPVTSVVKSYQVICEDKDGDGYYWWGLGPKPTTCNCPDTPDGNDADPTLGPLDQYGNCTPIGNTPVVMISADKTLITKGQSVSFNDISTNNPTSWAWTFAGGTPATSTSKTQNVTYSNSGNYNVTLTVSNAKGTSTKTFTNFITVEEPVVAPVADFSADKTSVAEGGAVTFSDLSTNNPTTWAWTFSGGNPGTSNSKNPVVTYSTVGTYAVTLVATNAGGSNTITKTGYITVNTTVKIPVAAFTANNTTITTGGSITFTDQSTNTPTAWSWSFSGGNPSTSTLQNPVVQYATEGTYDVTLTVKNSAGSDTIIQSGFIIVNAPVAAPIADFMADNTVITKGVKVNFADKSSNNPTSWKWTFNGGNASSTTVSNPSVTYDVAGTYDVALTVTNAGGTNTKTVVKYITVSEPQPTPPATYCTPAGLNSAVDYISSVVISNGVKNSTAGNVYSSYDGLSMAPGKSYSIAMTPKNTTARYYWKVWIDYNADGDFDDSGESVLSSANKKGTYKATISIPTNASANIRLRISMKLASFATACEGNYKGEVEDYSILISQTAASSEDLNNLTIEETDNEENLTPNNDISKFSTGLKIYPNPVADNLNFELNSIENGDSYKVFNLNGSEIITDKINSAITGINMTSFAPGIYILEVKNGFNTFREKVIKR